MAATGTDDLLEKSFYAIALIYIQDGVKKICITVHNAELPVGVSSPKFLRSLPSDVTPLVALFPPHSPLHILLQIETLTPKLSTGRY